MSNIRSELTTSASDPAPSARPIGASILHEIRHDASQSKPATQRSYKYQSQYDAVQTFVGKSEFGVVEKEVRHFTHQIKNAARWYFPEDKETYEIADATQSAAISLATAMRVLTLLTFVAFTNHTFELVSARPPATSANLTISVLRFAPSYLDSVLELVPPWMLAYLPSRENLLLVLDIAFAAVALGALRIVIRGMFLYLLIQKDVEVARGKLKSAHKDLISSCSKVAGAMSVIEDRTLWPEWAGKSAAVALWHAMRADYVDRYSTTSLWKIRRSFEVRERVFRAGKLAIAMGMLIFLYSHLNLTPPQSLNEAWSFITTGSSGIFLLGSATYLILAIYVWDRLFRAPNDFITIIFTEGTKGSARTNYFGEFETQVQNLANMTLTMSK